MRNLHFNCYCLHCARPMTFHPLAGAFAERCPRCGQPNRVRVLSLRWLMRFLLVDYSFFLLALVLGAFVDVLGASTAVFYAFGGSVLGSLLMGWLRWQCKHA